MLSDIVLPGECITRDSEITFTKSLLRELPATPNQNPTAKTYQSHSSGLIVTKKESETQHSLKISHLSEKYLPSQEDKVIGIVSRRTVDGFELDIRAEKKALLNSLAFEGATKKSKPNLNSGDLVFCRVAQVPSHLNIKVTCTSQTNKKEWSSGEALFGELKGGVEVVVPQFFSRFLAKNEIFFDQIRKRIGFEIVVGVNGVIWVKTKSLKNMLIIQDFLKAAPYLSMNRALELLSERASQFEQ
jgi:exosome complex component RRP40